MIPSRVQIGLMLLAVAAASVTLRLLAVEMPDAGVSLFGRAAAIGPIPGLAIGLGVAIVGAMVVGSVGNPLAGPFVVGLSLLFAADGNSIEGWVRRIDRPAAYGWLAIEAACWAGLIGLLMLGLRYGRPWLRGVLPSALRRPCYIESRVAETESLLPRAGAAAALVLVCPLVAGLLLPSLLADVTAALAIGLALLTVVWGLTLALERQALRLERRREQPAPLAPAFLGSAVCLAVGTLGVAVLQQSAEPGQVIGALLLSFTAGGIAAHQMFPTPARVLPLVTPLILAASSYLWTSVSSEDQAALLSRFYARYGVELLPAARALPIFYASAGVAGVAFGLGWSHAIHAARGGHVTVQR